MLTKISSAISPIGYKTGLVVALALSASLLTACGGGGSTTVSTGGTTTGTSTTDTSSTNSTTNTSTTGSTTGGTTTGGTTSGGTTTATKTFTKMDAAGGTVTAGIERVACAKDNQSGKFWEVKTDEPAGQTYKGEDFRDKDYGYFWYDGTNGGPGPAAGTATEAKLAENRIPCQKSGTALTLCDTKSYIAAVNAAKLCGKTTWRLPTKDELVGLVDKTQTKAPYIYTDLGSTASEAQVANQATRGYWTSTVSSADPLKRSAVSFGSKDGVVEDHFMVNQLYNYTRLIAD